jgi:excisionase family DNA binding protein
MPSTRAAVRSIPSSEGSGIRILTTSEVARELRCSKAHVHNLINGRVPGARPLPALWLGRRRLVRRTSLDQWLLTIEHGR